MQGVGFRPFVYQLARKCNLAGWVRNTGDGVLIEAEGNEDRLQQFLESVQDEAPSLAAITDVRAETISPFGSEGFHIQASISNAGTRPTVPPDVNTCSECLADVLAPDNRRYMYPFTNCTNCGPRFTIIQCIPYDRPNTTMRDFRMCPDCRAEYEDPSDRRFHAQPNACRVCGPRLSLDGRIDARDQETLHKAAELLSEGKILAIKGLGGFHLACDARNTQSVRTLRERKGRAGKPFAVMCADLVEARRICFVDEASESLLTSPEAPVVLMPAKPDTDVSPLVAPGNRCLGVMLPYTPLHHLLLAETPKTLVMTSGNFSEEPIAYRNEEALDRLGHFGDHILLHDRPIHMACDDSVARVFEGQPMVVRRARGYVPRPIPLGMNVPEILACGGDLKNTFCLTKGNLAMLSQHMGDLENAATLRHYVHVLRHLQDFFDARPKIIAHDMHPDYFSTKQALSMDAQAKIPVQHHHAHIVSCMVEHQLSAPVIGVAFDGTGCGTDGCIWGGEFLIADLASFRRAAHLSYLPMPGGEMAIRKPGRMALSYLLQALGPRGEDVGVELMPSLSSAEAYAVRTQIDRGLNTPLTSSMGRLFDAVSALLGICTESTYEGQAAMELEAAAFGPADEVFDYTLSKADDSSIEISVQPMIAAIAELKSRATKEWISGVFHATVADIVTEVCALLRQEHGLNQVVLSGGVFQNILLLQLVLKRLRDQGFEAFHHCQVPCNDGGLSLGQAVVAARRSAI